VAQLFLGLGEKCFLKSSKWSNRGKTIAVGLARRLFIGPLRKTNLPSIKTFNPLANGVARMMLKLEFVYLSVKHLCCVRVCVCVCGCVK